MIQKYLTILITAVLMLNVMPQVFAEGAGLTDAEEEIRIGHLMDHYAAEMFVMIKNDDLLNKIADITNKLSEAFDQEDITFNVRVLNEQRPLVFSFRGYIYISSGTLDLLDSEDELAALIAHSIAHVRGKDQHDNFVKLWRLKKTVMISHILLPLLAVSGAGVAATGVMAAEAAGEVVVSVLVAVSGLGTVASGISGAGLTSQENIPEGKIIFNRFGPSLSYSNPIEETSLLVFLNEIYSGYGKGDERLADELAISYLRKAGYKQNAYVTALDKISRSGEAYSNNGYASHIFLAMPGLEKRIEHADKIISNSQ